MKKKDLIKTNLKKNKLIENIENIEHKIIEKFEDGIDDIDKEIEKIEKNINKRIERISPYTKLLLLLISLILYFLFGAVFFHRLENLGFFHSLLIGFGSNYQTQGLQYIFVEEFVEMQTLLGQIFTIIFNLIGIFFVGIIYDFLSERFFVFQEKLIFSINIVTRKNTILFKLFFILFNFSLLFVVSTFTYFLLEKWKFMDSLMFTWVTITYLGNSNLVPKNTWTLIIQSFIILIGSANFFFAISTVLEYINTKNSDDAFNETLEKHLTESELKDIDENNDGFITSEEYIKYMIVKCELVDQEHVDRIYLNYLELKKKIKTDNCETPSNLSINSYKKLFN
jgi:hypothetical protein